MTAILILVSLVLLYFGAEWLVKGAASMAFRMGIAPLAVGLTVVAFGTSAPEFTVSTQAALGGLGDIAVTNVVGSNSFNIAFILGVAALICPIRISTQLIRWDIPVMIAVSVVCILCLWDKHLSRIEGAGLFIGIVFYTLWTFRQAKRDADPSLSKEMSLELNSCKLTMVWAIVYVIAGLALLVLGSKALIVGSLRLAKSFGISEAVIGLTIVSVGTSLPELATSVVAAIRKQADIAVGNIVGSNIFNILAILGFSSMLKPYSSPGLTGVDLSMMLGMAVLSLPLMWTGYKLVRWEGAVFLVCYGAYLYHLWPQNA